MWKSFFGGMVRLPLQALCKLEEREYVVNGFCRVPGMNWKFSQVSWIALTDALSVVGNNIRCVVVGARIH
jgi:hypothetical protein